MRRKSSPIPEWMPSASSSGRRSYGTDCQTRSVRPSRSCDPLEDPRRAEPAVLVVDRHDPAARRDPQPVARRLHELVLARHRDPGSELPGGLLAQNACRHAGRVALDHASVDLQIAVRARERGGVEPGRVVVLREEQRRGVAGDRVERGRRRLLVPLRRSPAVAADPAAASGMRANALERLGEARDTLQPHLALRERPGREVDVRVGEAGKDAAAAEIDDVRAGEDGLVRADPSRDVRARDRERPRGRQRRIHGADDAVLQDHARRLYREEVDDRPRRVNVIDSRRQGFYEQRSRRSATSSIESELRRLRDRAELGSSRDPRDAHVAFRPDHATSTLLRGAMAAGGGQRRRLARTTTSTTTPRSSTTRREQRRGRLPAPQ